MAGRDLNKSIQYPAFSFLGRSGGIGGLIQRFAVQGKEHFRGLSFGASPAARQRGGGGSLGVGVWSFVVDSITELSIPAMTDKHPLYRYTLLLSDEFY